MRKHNINLRNLILLTGIIIIVSIQSVFMQKSFSMPIGGDTDTSGTILIYFEKFYYQVNNGGTPDRIEVPLGVSKKDERYRYLEHKYFTTKDSAFGRAKEKIRGSKNFVTFPMSFEPINYSVNPTVEYVMHTGIGELYPGIIRRIYNINTGDTLEITTSELSIKYSPLFYSWSLNGQWLAISKDDKRGDGKRGSSIVIANLTRKEIREYKLDESIEAITWSPQSNMVAVFTKEWLRARTIWNYIFPPAWIQPETVRSFYLYIVQPNKGIVKKIEIAHRIDESICHGLYWVAESYK
jgi:hypothetical protein